MKARKIHQSDSIAIIPGLNGLKILEPQGLSVFSQDKRTEESFTHIRSGGSDKYRHQNSGKREINFSNIDSVVSE